MLTKTMTKTWCDNIHSCINLMKQLKATSFNSDDSFQLPGQVGSSRTCVTARSRPLVTRMESTTHGTATPQRPAPLSAPPRGTASSPWAWTTISTPAWPGACQSVTAMCLSLAASTVTRALRRGWWPSTRPPQRLSSCRQSAGGCGSTSKWIRTSLWVSGLFWTSLWSKSSPRSLARTSPSSPTPWSSLTPMTPRYWCGGQRMVTPWWSSHPNTDLFHWPGWPWILRQYHVSTCSLLFCSCSSPALTAVALRWH